MTPARLLERAAAALRRGEHREMAELLREAWRATRDPTLADVYELLVRAFSQPPSAAGDARALAGSGDPLELPGLLEAPGNEPWDQSIDELERLRLLAAWSPDPLLASALARRARLLAALPNLAVPEELEVQTLALLGAQRDPRQRDTLERLAANPGLRSRSRWRVRQIRPKLPAVRALGPEARRAMTTLAARARARREFETRGAELLAAIHADPERDEARSIYADWLSAGGDPRGEFIALQLERARTNSPPSTREIELLERHGASWCGPLHGLIGRSGRVFERGFLSAASIEVANLDGELADAGEWSTLRVIDGHPSWALLRRAPLDHLRELYGFLSLEQFIALRADNRLASVETYECSLAGPNLSLDTPLGLRTLVVRDAFEDILLWLCESPALHNLEQLKVYHHQHRLLRRWLPDHVRRLQMIDGETLCSSRPRGWLLTFERDELVRLSWLRVDWRGLSDHHSRSDVVTPLLGALAGLGLDSITRLTLGDYTEPDREFVALQLRELAEAHGCEFIGDT
jgi:uncharacterized protein (TIGR02996 family)